MGNVRAAVIPSPGQEVEVREYPEPELEQNSGMLAVELSEVCGTDVHVQRGKLAGVPYPLIPGHVSVGILEKIRGTLLDIDGQPLREGDRVTFLDVHRTCQACWYCLVAKASTRCPHRKVYGITYGAEDGLSGGWAEKVYLKPETRLIRIERLSFSAFMAGGCSLPTALHAVDRAQISIGDTVVVLGSGPVGLSAIIFAKMAGALQVLCLGAPANRLRTAREVGASAVLDIEEHDVDARAKWVREHTAGRGADVTIEAAGPAEAAIQALRFTRDAGRVVIVGQYTDHGEVSINPHLDINKKHLEIRGCWGSDFSHFYRGVQVLADPERAEPWTLIPLGQYGLDECNQALQAVASGRIVKALVDPRKA